jgi:hypothetical protein
MRWPWRHRGRRRRPAEPVAPQVDPWASSWGGTFLPALEPETAAQPSVQSVQLGFKDGTELELDRTSPDFTEIQSIAESLVARTDSGRAV